MEGSGFVMTAPEPVARALRLLGCAGYEAVMVGGCVRDALLGKTPSDYDIATAATPDQVMRVFSGERIVETGKKHGTVTLISGGMAVEITTFRVDGAYVDHRRPESVHYTASLREDVMRRDFTINALCYGASGLIDWVGGRADLAARRVRCVGDADARFSEDALRILRALRFCAVLEFKAERATAEAAFRGRALLERVSAERLCAELLKLLAGPGAPDVLIEYRAVFEAFLPPVRALRDAEWAAAARRVGRSEKRPALLLAAFLFDARAALAHLRLDGSTRARAEALIDAGRQPIPADRIALRRLAGRMGFSAARDHLALAEAEGADVDKARALLGAIERAGDCVTRAQLAVGGAEAVAVGLNGPSVGRALDALLDAVIEGRVDNSPRALMGLLRELAGG